MNRESAEEIPEVVSLEESETQVSTEAGDSQSPDLASQKDEEVPEGTSVITDTEISVSRAENLAMPEAVTVRNDDDDENFEIDRTGTTGSGFRGKNTTEVQDSLRASREETLIEPPAVGPRSESDGERDSNGAKLGDETDSCIAKMRSSRVTMTLTC